MTNKKKTNKDKPKKKKDTSQKYTITAAQFRSAMQSLSARLKQNPSSGSTSNRRKKVNSNSGMPKGHAKERAEKRDNMDEWVKASNIEM